MAPTGTTNSLIVKEWYDNEAGTMEGKRILTADGKIWRESYNPIQTTCVLIGEKRGNQIITLD